jgi:hypothetical protein
VIDDQHWDGLFGGFESEAELLLDSGEEGGSGVVGGRFVVWSPLKFQVVATGELRLVDNDTACDLGQLIGDGSHGQTLTAEMGRTDARAFIVGLGRLKFRTAFVKNQVIGWQNPGFEVGLQIAALDEEGLDHAALEVGGESAGLAVGLGLDVKTGGSKPGWSVEDLQLWHSIGPLHEGAKSDVDGAEAAVGRVVDMGVAVGGGSGRLDSSCFEDGVMLFRRCKTSAHSRIWASLSNHGRHWNGHP